MASTIYIIGIIVWMLFSTIANMKDTRYHVGVVTLSIILASVLWPISLVGFLIESALKWGRGQ
ncbi:hypothetical protein KpnPVR7901_55 [Klebsiella phage KpnP_VR7901]|nr:hypothetical protein KpnPVR7901_55 [Klebsiella phage KpnP_VR7901]